MTADNRDAIVVQYVKQHLSPTESEHDAISKNYLQLQAFLGERTFQSGSYARFTSTTAARQNPVRSAPAELAETGSDTPPGLSSTL